MKLLPLTLLLASAALADQSVYTDSTAIRWPGQNKWFTQSLEIMVNDSIVQSGLPITQRKAIISTPEIGKRYTVRIIGRYADTSMVASDPFTVIRADDDTDLSRDGITGMADYGLLIGGMGKCNLDNQHEIPCPGYRGDPKCDPEGASALNARLPESFCE